MVCCIQNLEIDWHDKREGRYSLEQKKAVNVLPKLAMISNWRRNTAREASIVDVEAHWFVVLVINL